MGLKLEIIDLFNVKWNSLPFVVFFIVLDIYNKRISWNKPHS
jgi:hypothetical protein